MRCRLGRAESVVWVAVQVEDDLPLDFAKKCLDDPSLLLTSDSEHLQQIKRCSPVIDMCVVRTWPAQHVICRHT